MQTEAERRIQTAPRRLLQSRTAFVIAHRLSTIREASAVVVMRHSRIVEVGTHDELLARGGGKSWRIRFDLGGARRRKTAML